MSTKHIRKNGTTCIEYGDVYNIEVTLEAAEGDGAIGVSSVREGLASTVPEPAYTEVYK